MEYLVIWLLFGIASMMVANSKGRSGCGWFLLGVLLGPFGLLFAFIAPSLKKAPVDPEAPTPETHVRCPDCKELVRKDARKCKHCGAALAPVEITPTGVRPADPK